VNATDIFTRKADFHESRSRQERTELAAQAHTYTAAQLSNVIQSIAIHDQSAALLRRVVRVVKANPHDPERTVRSMVTDWLTAGADDTWSGRSNDLRRVEYDATREVAAYVLATTQTEL
jgi:hypothetical protein